MTVTKTHIFLLYSIIRAEEQLCNFVPDPSRPNYAMQYHTTLLSLAFSKNEKDEEEDEMNRYFCVDGTSAECCAKKTVPHVAVTKQHEADREV